MFCFLWKILIKENFLSLSAAPPYDSFRLFSNNWHQCCKWICCMHRSTFTQHLDSLPSNSMIFVFYSLQCCYYNGLTTFSFLKAERGIDGSWDEFWEAWVRTKHLPFELVFIPVSARGFALFRQRDIGQLRKGLELYYKWYVSVF